MTSPVSHSQDVQSAIPGEEFIDDELHSQTLGNVCPENPLPFPRHLPPPPAGSPHPYQLLSAPPTRLPPHPWVAVRPPDKQPGGHTRNVSPSWVVLSPPLYPLPPVSTVSPELW